MDEMLVTFITVTLLILLLVSGIFLTLIISSRQRLQQQMLFAETKLAFEKELRTVETEVTENAMKRFAQELHDNIGQLLTALHIQVENQKLDHPQIAESFKPAEIYIAEISQHLRILSRTLNTDYLGHIGLLGALDLEAGRLRSLKRFAVHYDPPGGASNLQKDQELMTFRIFQEIVQNALRHSAAENLYLKVDNGNDGFMMEIRDDGRGFNKEEIMQSPKASGLRNIVKRAALAGLECTIDSKPGQGTVFVLRKISSKD
jgi:signal transduction histidine kinase